MADPLSIAAGVIGILSVAAEISSVLIKFTSTVKDAPKQAQVVATEVSDVSRILSHLQSFLLGTESYDRSRSSLLRVDQLVTLVGSCVLTFSELEKILHELKIEGMGLLNRIGWARKETIIMGLIQRLQNHKASLSLILNVLNGYGLKILLLFEYQILTAGSNTILEAKFSIDRLHVLMEDYYKDMVSRVQDLEQRERRWLGDESLTLNQDDSVSIRTDIGNSPDFSSFEFGFAESGSVHQVSFIEDLENSWVYKRNGVCRETASTFSITDAHSTTWSCLSSLSVAEISNISVISLPITVNEVFSSWRFAQTWSGNLRGSAGSSHLQFNFEASQKLTMQKVEAHFCRRCKNVRNAAQ